LKFGRRCNRLPKERKKKMREIRKHWRKEKTTMKKTGTNKAVDSIIVWFTISPTCFQYKRNKGKKKLLVVELVQVTRLISSFI